MIILPFRPDASWRQRLRARLERRRQTERYARPSPVQTALLALAVAWMAILPATAHAGDAVADPWAATEAVPDPSTGPAQPVRQAALPAVEPKTVTGRLSLAGGASISIPDGFVYLPWPEFQAFLALPSFGAREEAPQGVILSEDWFLRLEEERALAASREQWELVATRALLNEGPIEVHWEEGWIDASEGLPAAGQLLSDLQMHARLLNKRQALGRGLSITIDGWERTPTFDGATGILAWSLQTRWHMQAAPGVPELAAQLAHCCHLGAGGTVRLLCEAAPQDGTIAERMRTISSRVAWDRGSGFATSQPKGVGERTGGLRRVMLPRIVFGASGEDPLVFRDGGLGHAWILVLLPVAIAVFVVMRRIRSASRPPPIPVSGGSAPRCQTCGTPAPAGATRCTACGRSLVQAG